MTGHRPGPDGAVVMTADAIALQHRRDVLGIGNLIEGRILNFCSNGFSATGCTYGALLVQFLQGPCQLGHGASVQNRKGIRVNDEYLTDRLYT